MVDQQTRVIPRQLPGSVDPRLERIYQQWRDRRPIRDPAVSLGAPRAFFRRLADALAAIRRMGRSKVEVDVLIDLPPGAPTPPFLRGAVSPQVPGLFIGALDLEFAPRLAVLAGAARVEVARGLGVRLAHSTPEIRADAAAIATVSTPHPGYDGEGVIVGVLDNWCDINHPNFKDANGKSRILRLWRQNGITTPKSPQPYNYGQEYSKADIDEALGEPDPYDKVEGAPPAGSHGSHVLDIAAGNGLAGTACGVAPKADIIFVEVRPSDVAKTDFIGNSAQLAQAAQYAFAKADELNKPAVVNISLGAYGGPHDGTSLVDKLFDTLLQTPGRAIVVAAGNAFDKDVHASGAIAAGGDDTLTWTADPGDKTENELEIWYSGGSLQVFVTPPGGVEKGPFSAGAVGTFNLGANIKCYITHSAKHPLNGLGHIDIFMSRLVSSMSVPAGDWKIRLAPVGAASVAFDAWIEREFKSDANARQTRFPAGADKSRTLDSIACSHEPIVVGAYPCDAPNPKLSRFTAAGTTRDGRKKPDICAPGERGGGTGIFAADAVSGGVTTYTGTSQAAPHVAGVVALMMQKALLANPPRRLSIAEIRQILQQTARPIGAPMTWHAQGGFGRVDAVEAIKKV
ncbi:S8 family serine peptidase [Phenylobacterium sp.]|uniref:S8 family serine peptidase n=1 Tax=Phenylobacterium sp. TaxID=1871053 RepID=UPI002ED797D9